MENPYAAPGAPTAPIEPALVFGRRQILLTLLMLASPWFSFFALVIVMLAVELGEDTVAISGVIAVTVPSLFAAVFTPLHVSWKAIIGVLHAGLVWTAFYFLFG